MAVASPDLHPPIVELIGIRKRFGPVVANDGVDLAVLRGEIHCLLGENGAGKSTLMKILYGLYPPDGGEIRVRGQKVHIRSPRDAMALGIGMVHQHFMLVDRLTVAENLIAGQEPVRNGLLDLRRARQAIREMADRYGLRVDPDARVQDLSVGEQQRVEILKALMRNVDILILDEPTAVLTPQEVDELFRVMLQLKADGKTLIFITHKLRETMAFSDRVTVLRNGRHVGTWRTADTSPEQLAEMMVGRQVTLRVARPHRLPGDVLLELDRVSAIDDRGQPRLRDVTLSVRSGEILGIAGVEGNGQLELEEVIAGLRPISSGRIRINGQEPRQPGPRGRRALGLAHIPSDRLRRGLAAPLPVTRNGILGRHWQPPFARRGVLREPAIRSHVGQLLAEFQIRGRLDAPASTLSGGNQQKLVVARELAHGPRVILACQPTRGVDVGAIEHIHSRLLEMRAAGAAILLISADLDELLALSDRLVVMYEGTIVAEGPADRFTRKELGLWMAGQRPDRAGSLAQAAPDRHPAPPKEGAAHA
ncbi:MAG: ABC transporter ATP-binding protein [Bacillota bacterium]|nr:heme ABC transporter ATP-binding protein [Bacillota bacterium]REJ36869.1 MAG: heme ABC transporter ATP-binding protein [Bacillota bacterium]